jgi:hypothetical protein
MPVAAAILALPEACAGESKPDPFSCWSRFALLLRILLIYVRDFKSTLTRKDQMYKGMVALLVMLVASTIPTVVIAGTVINATVAVSPTIYGGTNGAVPFATCTSRSSSLSR